MRLCPVFFEAALADSSLAIGSASVGVTSRSLAGNGWIVQASLWGLLTVVGGDWQTDQGGLCDVDCTAVGCAEMRAEQLPGLQSSL